MTEALPGGTRAALRPSPDDLRAVVPAACRWPAWLYWASWAEGELGEAIWRDGRLPVLAFATLAGNDDDPPASGSAVLVPDPALGPLWIRVLSDRRIRNRRPGDPVFHLAVILGKKPPKRGGRHAPRWLKKGRSWQRQAKGAPAQAPWH